MSATQPSDRPNILLVVLDTARADHFGPWGGRARTPVFDRLAAEGIAVPNARSSASWTVPSHATMFTGLLPFEHGVTGVAADSDPRLVQLRPSIARNSDHWLPLAMQRAGYRTFGISANAWVTPPTGFDLGFETFVPVGRANLRMSAPSAPPRRWFHRAPMPVRRAIKRPFRAAVTRPRRAIASARHGRDFGSMEAVTALAELAVGGDRPFFGFVNIIEPHAPYLPPDACNPLRGLRRLRAPFQVERYLMGAHPIAYNAGGAEIPPRAMAAFSELYAGEIAYSDMFLGRVLDVLTAARVLDDTLLVVTSDHGENLGEDHLVGHQASLDDRLLHVPLVFSGPRSPTVPAVTGLFPMNGLAWTLASAAGLDGPWQPPGTVAVSQLRAGTISLAIQAAADGYGLTEPQRLLLRRSIEQATDGVTTVTIDSPGPEVVTGPASGAPALRLAIEAARGDRREPPGPPDEDPALSPKEQEEIEARLSELGYI